MKRHEFVLHRVPRGRRTANRLRIGGYASRPDIVVIVVAGRGRIFRFPVTVFVVVTAPEEPVQLSSIPEPRVGIGVIL